jgi:hypothetical protein
MELDEETEVLDAACIPPAPASASAAAQEVPPDFKKAFTVKCSLKKFCRSAALCAKLNEAALLMDRLVTEVYHLINLDLRVRYELATEPPVEYNWTCETVLMYFYAVSECKGAKYKSHKEVERLIQLRIEHYDDIRNGLPLEKRDKLPVKEAATRIAAAIVTTSAHIFWQGSGNI